MIALFLTHPVDWLVNNGVGQNMTAGAVTVVLGYLWSRTRFWPLSYIKAAVSSLHEKADQLLTNHKRLGDSIAELHQKHDETHDRLAAIEQHLKSNPTS